jgi:rRNA maturation endonuclease Nob1
VSIIYRQETECPACYAVYKVADFVTCPGCGVNPDKDGSIVRIIEVEA